MVILNFELKSGYFSIGWIAQDSLQRLESLLAGIVSLKLKVLLQKFGTRLRETGKVPDETAVISRQAQKLPDLFDIGWSWELLYCL